MIALAGVAVDLSIELSSLRLAPEVRIGRELLLTYAAVTAPYALPPLTIDMQTFEFLVLQLRPAGAAGKCRKYRARSKDASSQSVHA